MWIWLVLWGAAFVVRESEEIRFDLIYAPVGDRDAGGSWSSSPRPALVVLFAISLPAVVDYVTFMKVREHRLSRHPLRLAVLDLRRLRGRRRSSATSGSAGGRCGARRRTPSIRPRRARAYEPRQPVLARDRRRSPSLALLGLPIGHAMIAGSILYLLLAGQDMGTVAEQLLNGMYTRLHHPRGAALHPRRRAHEHRHDDRAAAALLRCAGRPLPRRARAGQRRAEHHLRRHVRLGHRRRRRLRQDDAEHDDPRRQVSRRASPRR